MMTATKNTKAFYNTEIPRDWSTPDFGDVFNFLKTFSFSRDQLTSETTNDKIRNIHYGDIHSTYENEILDLEIEQTVPYLLDGIIDPKCFDDESFPALKEGDLIIADASEDYMGVCDCVELKNINGAKIVSGLHTFAARATDGKIAIGYRTYSLQHEQVIRELRRIATGTSVYGVSKTNLSKVKIPLPPLPEQKAIAQVLSTADAAIHTTEKLIAQKELRKKWLMQQLLTGKKRLKRFGGEVKLKVVEHFLKEVSERNKDLKITNVLSVTNSRGFINQAEQFDRVVASEDATNYKIVRKEQFAYNPSRVNVGSLDLLRDFESGILSPMYVVFETDKSQLLPDYFYYQLKTQWFYGHIPMFVQGSVRDSLSFDGLCSMKFFIPSIEEQTAIAQVLQAADKEISLLKAKAEKLREQKKGLMQVLLTGKVRLKIN